MAHQQFKLSNVAQASASVPTGWGLQHGIWSPVEQNIAFQPDNPQNYHSQENHKRGQAAPGLLQKGKTISDIKTLDLKRADHMRTKDIGSLNPFSSEGMSATQLLRHQEKPFSPCNIHPPFRMDGNPSFFNGPFLSHHQLKESSGVYMDGFPVGQISRKHVSYIKDQVVSPGSQEKNKKDHAPTQLGGRKLQQSAYSSGLLCITRDPSPKADPIQDDNVSKSLDVGGGSIPAAILPFRSIPKKDPPCIFNQNPADIADADDQRYFRIVEDQRLRDKSSLGEKFRAAVKLDGRQRHRRKEMTGRMSVVSLKSKFC